MKEHGKSWLVRILVGALFMAFLIAASIELKKNIHEVIPNKVYRSAQLSPKDLEQTIQKHGIKTILNLRGSHPGKVWFQEESKLIGQLNLTHENIALNALSLPRYTDLPRLIKILQKSKKPILIHCQGGADRAGLVSAIALLLEGRRSLEDVYQQASWRYLALSPKSAGKQFLNKYSQWLNDNKVQTNANVFQKWSKEHYIDGKGNLKFYVDAVNGAAWKEQSNKEYRHTVVLGEKTQLRIEGWGFNEEAKELLKNVEVLLDSKPLSNGRYGRKREDVAELFNEGKYLKSGWFVEQNISAMEEGCYTLKLRLSRLNNTKWLSSSFGQICLVKP
ncbi:MAG: hypothetical protein DRR42_24375 [Gammaproteobacteria bacterium]|nr:MAG: hypothetical protein DRR42_24375 [Gammaproteobacteria bacterium]